MGTSIRDALRDGWPLLVSSMLIGVPFGIAAREAGLEPLQVSGMSVLIFAGAAQFAAAQLIAHGAAGPVVVLTVLLLNLRHLLMAAALRPMLGARPLAQRLGLAYVLTDESFAMGIGRLRRGHTDVAYYGAFAVSLWLAWNVASIAGAVAGSAIADPRALALDFAITATFVAIVVLGARGRGDVMVALVAAILAGALRLAGASAVAVVAAGALAPLVAVLRERDP